MPNVGPSIRPHAAPLACALALTALALVACTGNAPPPNYASTGPDSTTEPAAEGASSTPPTQPAPEATGTDPDPERDSDAALYEQCPDALVDAWLHLGTGDPVSAQDFAPHAVEVGSQPTGDAQVRCAVGLEHPDGDFGYALIVLAGETVTEDVASAAAEAGLEFVESGRTGTVANYTSPDDTVGFTLFGPPDRVLSMSGIDGADTAFLLEGTRSNTR